MTSGMSPRKTHRPTDGGGHHGRHRWSDQAGDDPRGGQDSEHARPARLWVAPGDGHVGHRGHEPGPEALYHPPRHQHGHIGSQSPDGQAGGEEDDADQHRPPQRATVGQRPGLDDPYQAGQHEGAESPAVETKVSQMAPH
jgi:hypothetical protein